MSRLSILFWYWRQEGGRARFLPEHVNIAAAMVRRHCTLDIEIACVTNLPEGLDPSIRVIDPPGFYDDLKTSRWRGGRPSCYRRIALFRPDAADIFGADRFASMDLDCVIGGNIDRIFGRGDDFVICGPSSVGPRYLYNGSLLLMDAGARPSVYNEFTPEAAEIASRQFVGSDQAWIAHTLGRGEATFTADDGVVRWNGDRSGPMMFFPGHIKPWDCTGDHFVGENYRLDGGRSALILGDKPHVWQDAEQAKGRHFDRIIALPKAARAWRGKVDHVASDLGHARRLARMLGVDEPVICGA